MGQTQILFIVLSVIIVGIAVAVGITQFGQNAVEANKNAIILDANSIGSKAGIWYRKPTSMGGGGGTFTGVDFDKMGMTDQDGSPTTYTNDNATYSLSVDNGDQITITLTKAAEPANASLAFTVTPDKTTLNQ